MMANVNQAREREIRLELLIGHLSDVLSPARELVGALHVRTNASAATRTELETIQQMLGVVWQQLNTIREEMGTLHKE